MWWGVPGRAGLVEVVRDVWGAVGGAVGTVGEQRLRPPWGWSRYPARIRMEVESSAAPEAARWQRPASGGRDWAVVCVCDPGGVCDGVLCGGARCGAACGGARWRAAGGGARRAAARGGGRLRRSCPVWAVAASVAVAGALSPLAPSSRGTRCSLSSVWWWREAQRARR